MENQKINKMYKMLLVEKIKFNINFENPDKFSIANFFGSEEIILKKLRKIKKTLKLEAFCENLNNKKNIKAFSSAILKENSIFFNKKISENYVILKIFYENKISMFKRFIKFLKNFGIFFDYKLLIAFENENKVGINALFFKKINELSVGLKINKLSITEKANNYKKKPEDVKIQQVGLY